MRRRWFHSRTDFPLWWPGTARPNNDGIQVLWEHATPCGNSRRPLEVRIEQKQRQKVKEDTQRGIRFCNGQETNRSANKKTQSSYVRNRTPVNSNFVAGCSAIWAAISIRSLHVEIFLLCISKFIFKVSIIEPSWAFILLGAHNQNNWKTISQIKNSQRSRYAFIKRTDIKFPSVRGVFFWYY